MSSSPLSDPPPPSRPPTEAPWPFEAVSGSLPLPHRLVPRGDGHAVLVLPGFLADDRSTIVLRETMRAHGYRPRGWGLRRNLGPSHAVVDGMLAALEHLAGDGRQVSVVGWSLGGVYARWLARTRPDLVRQVITLASAFRTEEGARSPVRLVWDEVEELDDGAVEVVTIPESEHPPLRVPATSIYTRTDAVVRWQLCLDDTGPAAGNPRAENIEVYGTHVGLGFNPAAFFAVLDRLAQPEDGWRRFTPPAVLRLLYPTPPRWRPLRTEAVA